MNLSFTEFYNRISDGHYSDDSAWRKEVGYRPEDKDSGFTRWLELTGNKASDFMQEFRSAVYSGVDFVDIPEKQKEEYQQCELF